MILILLYSNHHSFEKNRFNRFAKLIIILLLFKSYLKNLITIEFIKMIEFNTINKVIFKFIQMKHSTCDHDADVRWLRVATD